MNCEALQPSEGIGTMSRPNVVEALNSLLAIQCCSMVNYLSEARPWTHPGNEVLMEATRSIVANHKHYSQRLANAIEDGDGNVNSSSFPMTFTSLNDLALYYLLVRLTEDQQSNVQAAKQCMAEMVEDSSAWSLASEVVGNERAHLDIMKEFLPHTAPVPIQKHSSSA